jgi:hypothetical protein
VVTEVTGQLLAVLVGQAVAEAAVLRILDWRLVVLVV